MSRLETASASGTCHGKALSLEMSVLRESAGTADETANYTKEFLEGHLGEDRAHAAVEYVGEYGLPSNVSAAQGPHWDIMLEAASKTLSEQVSLTQPSEKLAVTPFPPVACSPTLPFRCWQATYMSPVKLTLRTATQLS